MMRTVRLSPNVSAPWGGMLLIGLGLPPIVSVILMLCLYRYYKKTCYGVLAAIFFSLFLSYNFFSIDCCGRYNMAMETFGEDAWYLGDPLTNLMRWGVRHSALQCSNFFLVYLALIYIFWFLTLRQCYSRRNSNLFIFFFLTVVWYRNSMDLMYYTLSLVFALFLVTRKDKMPPLEIVAMVVVCYLLHPGVLIILLPAIGLYYVLGFSNKTGKLWIYYLTLAVLYLLFMQLSHFTATSIGVPIVDAMLDSFSSYTSDQAWGSRQGDKAIAGITYTIIFYVIPLFYLLLGILLLKHLNNLRQRFVVAVFHAALLFYPSFLDFVTLTERCLVILSITSILCALVLAENTSCWLRVKHIAAYCVLIFFFNFSKGAGSILLQNVFRANSDYQAIRNRSYYLPSCVLIDYADFGYSDDFLKSNINITF